MSSAIWTHHPVSYSAIRSATSRQITEILALLAIGCGPVACSSSDSGEGLASNGGTATLAGGSSALGQGGSSLSAASQQGGSSAASGGTAVDAGGTSASGAVGGTEAGGNPAAVTTTPALDVSSASVNRVKVVKVADRTLGFSTEAVGISTPMRHGIDTNPGDRDQMIGFGEPLFSIGWISFEFHISSNFQSTTANTTPRP